MDSFYRNEVTTAQKAAVIDKFLTISPIDIRWELGRQSGLMPDNVLVSITPWAGPTATLSNLVHEMSHFVEIDERRMTLMSVV